MKKIRIGVLAGLAVMAVSAAPASAQVSGPPCTPGIPVPDAVNCTFDTAVWGVQTAQQAPNTALGIAQDAANDGVRAVQDAVVEYGNLADVLERGAIETVCYVAFGDPNCPSI